LEPWCWQARHGDEKVGILQSEIVKGSSSRGDRQTRGDEDRRAFATSGLIHQAYRDIFDAVSDALFIHDAETGAILEVNEATVRMFGYSREAIFTEQLSESMFAGGQFRLEEARNRMRLALEGAPQVFEWRCRHCSGREFWGEITLRSAEIGGHQRVLALVRDINTRREAEEKLHLQAAAMEQLLDGLCILDLEGRVRYVNSAFTRMHGHDDPERLVGLHVTRFLDGDKEHTEIATWMARAHATGGRDVLTQRLRQDGTRFTGRVTAAPWLDAQDQPQGFIGVVQDVTEQLKLEQQLAQAQRMETVGQLAGGVAHDFNNLLTPILGYSEIMVEDLPEGSPIREPAETIHRAASRARELTQQLLAFSRKQLLTMRSVDLNDVVLQAIAMLQRTIREDIQVTATLASKATTVRADAGQLQQVLLNLAINAQDAMEAAGQLKFCASEVTVDEDLAARRPGLRTGPHVQLTVTDTGSGIDADTMSHVFEPFFTTKGVGKGTGLGLATVFGIVQQHRGQIWVESILGQGTTFTILLPSALPAPVRAVRAPRALASSDDLTILVAEDSDVVRNLAEKVLKRLGYTVITSCNADACITAAQEHDGPIHLLLTDVVMPGCNGRELYEQLRVLDPALKVLFMSGYPKEQLGSHGVLEDDTPLLQKPFSVSTLSRMLRELLEPE
jgi:PAS domain S-box-containing protein